MSESVSFVLLCAAQPCWRRICAQYAAALLRHSCSTQGGKDQQTAAAWLPLARALSATRHMCSMCAWHALRARLLGLARKDTTVVPT